MRKPTEKKIHLYEIQDTDGTPLDLMNVLTYKDEVLDSVHTFIGRHDRHEFLCVGSAEDLSAPGTLFNYRSFVRQQESLMRIYVQTYHDNLHGKVYTPDGGFYMVDEPKGKASSGAISEYSTSSIVPVEGLSLEAWKHLPKQLQDKIQKQEEEKQRKTQTQGRTDEHKVGGTVVKGKKVGANDPCPCGSGKKYKKCCGRG